MTGLADIASITACVASHAITTPMRKNHFYQMIIHQAAWRVDADCKEAGRRQGAATLGFAWPSDTTLPATD
jgi:hypothetical protein